MTIAKQFQFGKGTANGAEAISQEFGLGRRSACYFKQTCLGNIGGFPDRDFPG
jgi:hypothetical protein